MMNDLDESLLIAKEALGLVSLSELGDATIPTMGQRLAQAEEIARKAKDVRDALELMLVDRMEADDVKVPGLGWIERRNKAQSTAGSDYQGARLEGRAEIMRRVAFDKATGEVRKDWEYVAGEAIDLMMQAFSVQAPKGPFKTLLGLDPGDFMKYSPGGKYIAIRPEGPSE